MLVTPIGKKFFKFFPGELFDLPEKTALKLISVGLIARAEEPEQSAAEISPRTGLPKRQYRRRDLRAESI